MMDRMSHSNDRVSEEYTFNRSTEISQFAFTQGGQDVWRQGQMRNENTANNFLPQCDFIQQPQEAANSCPADQSAANSSPFAGLPNPNQLMSSLMGGGDSSNSSPLSGIGSLLGGFTGGGSPLGGDSGSGSSSSDSSANTAKTVEEAATVAALFV